MARDFRNQDSESGGRQGVNLPTPRMTGILYIIMIIGKSQPVRQRPHGTPFRIMAVMAHLLRTGCFLTPSQPHRVPTDVKTKVLKKWAANTASPAKPVGSPRVAPRSDAQQTALARIAKPKQQKAAMDHAESWSFASGSAKGLLSMVSG